jgi:hypothetical protein
MFYKCARTGYVVPGSEDRFELSEILSILSAYLVRLDTGASCMLRDIAQST